MLLITNLQLERKIDSKEHQKVYILNLHTLDSEFINDVNFFDLSCYISLFVLVLLINFFFNIWGYIIAIGDYFAR